jgi:hypothetical protein
MNGLGWRVAFGLVLLGLGCGSSVEAPGEPLPDSLKGYELYSWRSQPVGDDWCFTLITGTNRWKVRSEIGPPDQDQGGWAKISVCDLAALERALARIPRRAPVFWTDGEFVENDAPRLPPLAFPEVAVIERIKARAAALGIQLRVKG